MSLSVILGKSNTGKSEYIFNKIMACEDSKQAILFVPSSSRVIAEQEYLKYTKKSSITNVQITSLDRYIDKNVNKKELYNTKEYLPELAKKMLIRKVVLENGDVFEIFSRVKNNTNFIDKLCGYMDTLKKQELDVQDLTSMYNEQDYLGRKIQELENIYKKIDENIGNRFVTSIDATDYYIKSIEQENMKDYEFFWDGYNNFTKQEYEYIKKILVLGSNVTITLDIDLNKHLSGETEIYNTSYQTLEFLEEIAKNSGVKFFKVELEDNKENTKPDIKYLADNIFSLSKKTYEDAVENVSLVLKENTYNEIEYIATDILKNIQNGYRYKDVVIYTNDMDTYMVGINRIFSRYEIPVYLNYEQNILSNDLVVYLITLLNIVSKGLAKDVSDVITLLKTGYIKSVDVLEFERYIKEFGIKGYMLNTPFKLNNKKETDYIYDIQSINETREKVLSHILDLKENLKSAKKASEITNVIYNYINEKEVVNEYINQLEKVKEENENEYNKQKQVITKLYEIMDNISLAYESITLEEYIALFEYGAKEIKVDTIPENIDQVYVADINKNRGLEKKIGYIIGAYDGGLPSIQNEDSIFSDAELNKLKEKNIDLKQTRIDRNNMQLFNIYHGINKIRDKLVITVPSSKMTGGSLRPSSLIQTIKNMLNIKLESVETNTELNINSNFMELITKICELEDTTNREYIEELYNEYMMYLRQDKYKDILEYVRGDKNLKPETLELIYNENISSSVSRLEQFKRCPFAYYSNYILKLKEAAEYKVTNMDIGSFMHEVIEKFSKFIISKNISWTDVKLDEKKHAICLDKIESIVDELFSSTYDKYLQTARYVVLKNKLKKSVTKTILAIADSFNQSEFRPLGYEISFEQGELFAPIKIELDNGKNILLRGKIDRVDSLDVDGNTYLRIVDYKSSEKNLNLKDVKDGINLQLMTYMWAMVTNKEKINKEGEVIPAAVSYFTISNKLLNIPAYEQDESKISEKLKNALKLRGIFIKDIEILEKMDGSVNTPKESYLEVTSKLMQNENKALEKDMFIKELNNMKKILKDIANEIVQGKVAICPNSKIKGVCDYCKFNEVCRKSILN